MDWHDIGLGAITILVGVGGYLWAQAAQATKDLNTKLDSHIHDDTLNFSKVFEVVNANQVEILNRISGRWSDEDNRRR